ncbi:MAG: transglutaminase domain-containing protein [Calditrichia bacterium]
MNRWFVSLLFTVFLGGIGSGLSYPGKVVSELRSPGAHCTGMTFDGKNLWVADQFDNAIYCVNVENGKILKKISAPGYWPVGLAWDGKYLWNVDQKQNKIYKIDPNTGEILTRLDAPTIKAEGLAWDGQSLWIVDGRDAKIMKIDLSDGTAVQIYQAPAKHPVGLTYDGQYLWCSDRIMDELYMIDPQNGEVILVTDAPGPYSRGLAFGNGHIFNVDYEKDRIYKLIHWDDEPYRLKNPRTARLTFTHRVNVTGSGKLTGLDVWFSLPENMPQQRIMSTRIIPNEYQSVEDKWHQPIAWLKYKEAEAGSQITSTMIVDAEIHEISYFILPHRCGSRDDIPKDIRELYTQDGSKYQINHPFIRKMAREIVGDETNPYWIARKLFDYVRNTLEYKLEGGWNTAPVVLQRGTGSCSEYTFSFVALCRAVGLPARYVGAFVVRGDDASLDDVFHRWPEVYLPNYGWVPIDPQGGDKPSPRDRALNIGHLPNRFLIVTQGGGDSEYLGWYYISNEAYKCLPKTDIVVETFGDWQPIVPK